MNYSKGKWITYKIASYRFGFQQIESNMPIGEITFYQPVTYKQSIANAKLISKAPEMYEALKVVIETNHAYGHTEGATLAKIESLLKEIQQ